MKKYIFICAAGAVILVVTILVYVLLPASLPASGRATDYPLAEPLRISEAGDLIRLYRVRTVYSGQGALIILAVRATFFNDTQYVLVEYDDACSPVLEKYDLDNRVVVPMLPESRFCLDCLWGIFPSNFFNIYVHLADYATLRPGPYRMRRAYVLTSTFPYIDWDARHTLTVHDVVVKFTVCRDGEISFADD